MIVYVVEASNDESGITSLVSIHKTMMGAKYAISDYIEQRSLIETINNKKWIKKSEHWYNCGYSNLEITEMELLT